MTQTTVKTPYYYQLLTEVKGKGRRAFPAQYESSNQSISTEEVPQVIQIPAPKLRFVKKVPGMISNIFQNLLLVFVKRARISFPLVRVCFRNGELAGREFYIYNINPPGNPAGYIKIGRENTQKEKYFITLSQRTVSRTHAKIVFFNEELFIVNYSNINPIQVNGQKIPFNKSVHLPEGAIVSLGGVELTAEKIKS
jgi:hypothetical protein